MSTLAGKTAHTVHHPLRDVDDVGVIVEETVWADGGRSFDVWEADLGNQPLELLTGDESFDDMPTDDQIRAVLPAKQTFVYAVVVSGCTRNQADTVIRERVGHDEDLGFTYAISCDDDPNVRDDDANVENEAA